MAASMRGSMVGNFLATQSAVDEQGDKFRTDRARLTAGNALRAGDYGAGANALLGSGDLAGGQALRTQGAQITGSQAYARKDYGAARDAFAGVGDAENIGRVDSAETGQKKQAYEFMQRAARTLEADLDRGGPEAVAAAYDSMAPLFAKIPGATPESIAQTREMLTNPDPVAAKAAFRALNEAVAKELQFFEGPDGIYAADKATGNVERKMGFAPKREPVWKERTLPDGSTEWFDLAAEAGGAGPGSGSGQPASGPAPKADDLFGALIMQESGGKAGVLGPQTQYGRAEGMTQMLPETAREMARKVGVQWRPELMRGTTPEAAEYQQTLGRAYLDEGLQKYGGDVTKALMYYHGGPNERLWGPKTRRYAQEVQQRLAPYQVASNGPTPPPPSRSAPTATPLPGSIRGSAPKAAEWTELSGPEAESYGVGRWQKNSRTGEVKQVSGTDQRKQEPTVDAKKTVAFTYRTLAANDRLNALIEEGITKPTAWKLVSDKNGVSRLIVNNQNDRRFISASKEWLAPILRKDTGAAVTDQEFLYYADMFIPAPEDGPELLKQKAEARQSAMIALAQEAGPLYTRTHGRREFKARWAPTPKSPAAEVPPPARRKRNTTYQTPKGPMTWTGTGWIPANAS